MSEMVEQASEILNELAKAQTWGKVCEFRQIVPQGTTTEPPKLQQAWRCLETGEIRWETVGRVVVTNAEFYGA